MSTLTLRLTTDEAIIIKNALMVLLQESQPESRPDIQEILDAVDIYLAICCRSKDVHEDDRKPV